MSEETNSLLSGQRSEIYRAGLSLFATVLLGLLTYIGGSILDGIERLERNHALLVERVRISEVAAIGTQSTIVGLVERITRMENAREWQIRDMERRSR